MRMGGWRKAETVRRAKELNHTLRAVYPACVWHTIAEKG